jgi:hypothetical protein
MHPHTEHIIYRIKVMCMVRSNLPKRKADGYRHKWMLMEEYARLDKSIKDSLEIVRIGSKEYSKRWVQVRILDDSLAYLL